MALKISLCQLIMLAVAVTAWAAPKTRRAAQPPSAKSAAAGALARMRGQVLNARPLAMFYYADDSLGIASLRAHADAMTLLAPQCYGARPMGALHGHFLQVYWK